MPTHFITANGTESAIELTISSSSISKTIKWEVSDDLYDSDDYPIITHTMDKT